MGTSGSKAASSKSYNVKSFDKYIYLFLNGYIRTQFNMSNNKYISNDVLYTIYKFYDIKNLLFVPNHLFISCFITKNFDSLYFIDNNKKKTFMLNKYISLRYINDICITYAYNIDLNNISSWNFIRKCKKNNIKHPNALFKMNNIKNANECYALIFDRNIPSENNSFIYKISLFKQMISNQSNNYHDSMTSIYSLHEQCIYSFINGKIFKLSFNNNFKWILYSSSNLIEKKLIT